MLYYDKLSKIRQKISNRSTKFLDKKVSADFKIKKKERVDKIFSGFYSD